MLVFSPYPTQGSFLPDIRRLDEIPPSGSVAFDPPG
jgi:hypothetical protein